MISTVELKKISRARMKDAEALYSARRYDGATYLCGYALELSLKARICKAIHWKGYPETNAEFQNYQSFKTHNLETLLHLSAAEDRIKTTCLAEWSIVLTWDPTVRYKAIGTATPTTTLDMINSARTIIGAL
jgi:hypothetical protein